MEYSIGRQDKHVQFNAERKRGGIIQDASGLLGEIEGAW